MSLLNELKRRNVFKVGIAYIVIAWLVAQVLQLVMESFVAPAWVMKTVLVLLAAGIPFALLFAWVFELTPEGIKREHEVDRTESITPQTSRKLDFVIISILVIAVGYFAWDKFSRPGDELSAEAIASGQNEKENKVDETDKAAVSTSSIAVLPFVNMSPDKDQEYFSDGISEEILNVLAQIPDLHVTSRSSAFAFKGKNIDIPTVAAQLGVANVLEGSVRKAGNKVRITAQLIEAETDRHLWSETYDRELDDIFAIQDEISTAIVTALKGHLDLNDLAVTKIEDRRTGDTAAYQAYLRGRHLIVQRTRPTLDAAVLEFQNAVRIDPEFALAHAQLAVAHMLLINGQYGDYSFEEATALARPHADKAMELDPTLAESQAAAGFVLWHIGAPKETMAYLEEALRINPNQSQVLNWMSVALNEMGEYTKAFEIGERLLQLDPLSVPNLGNMGNSYSAMGQTESMNHIVSVLNTLSPAGAADVISQDLRYKGHLARSAEVLLEAIRREPLVSRPRLFLGFTFVALQLGREAELIDPPVKASNLWVLGQHDEIVRLLTEKAATSKLTVEDQRYLGQAYAAIGEYDKAIPMLEYVWEKAEHRVAAIGEFSRWDAAALIVARRASNPDADVHALIEAMAQEAQRMSDSGQIIHEIYSNEGLAAWFNNDVAAALFALEKAKYVPYDMPYNLHYLQDLINHPGYAPIRERQQAWRDAERHAFLTEVCLNNPYAEVWEPQSETCEDFEAVELASR